MTQDIDPHYQSQLNKALELIKNLEIKPALKILLALLTTHPNDLPLIERIYKLAVKKPHSIEFNLICGHIFYLSSLRPPVHQRVIEAYQQWVLAGGDFISLDPSQVFNLFSHLVKTGMDDHIDKVREHIKRQFAEAAETPAVLQLDCEQLITKKQLIKAKQQLDYLSIYYAETDAGRWAIIEKKRVSSKIIQ